MVDKDNKDNFDLKPGENNTVIGQAPDWALRGSGNTIINLADANGDCFLHQYDSVAVGINSKAGRYSYAVGANANAGSFVDRDCVEKVREELYSLLEMSTAENERLKVSIDNLIEELNKPQPKPSMISKALGVIETLAAFDGASNTLVRVSALLVPIIGS